MKNLVALFAKSRSGNVLPAFAVSSVALIAMIGVAIDTTRMVNARRTLQLATDAAALAAGSSLFSDPRAVVQEVRAYISANAPGLTIQSVNARAVSDGVLEVSATALPPAPIFMTGESGKPVRALAQVSRANQKLEVVLVIDNTWSMTLNNGWRTVRTAAQNLITQLEAINVAPDDVRVGLVVYTSVVNIRGPEFSWDWIDRAGASTWHGSVFEADGSNVNVFDLYDRVPNAGWMGCVEQRANDLHATDVAPDSGDPDTLWTPYFAPDEHDDWTDRVGTRLSGKNDYLSDDNAGVGRSPSGTTLVCDAVSVLNDGVCQRASVEDPGKYDGEPYSDPTRTTFRRGPNASCDPQPILPLTSNLASISAALRTLEKPTGWGTNTATGVMWGHRVLSPGAPYTSGGAFEDPSVKKVLVIMTDGMNTAGRSGTEMLSPYSAFGYAVEARLGTTDPHEMGKQFDTHTTDACDVAKKKNVEVYSLVFSTRASRTHKVFKECASSETHFIAAPNVAAFDAAFTKIGKSIASSMLHLSH